MVKQFTGFDEAGNPQSEDEYLAPARGCLPIMVGLTAGLFVAFIIVALL